MLRGSKNETLEKAFRRHQNPVAVQKNSPKFKSAASATAVPNTIVSVHWLRRSFRSRRTLGITRAPGLLVSEFVLILWF